jgi:hypothetical protein
MSLHACVLAVSATRARAESTPVPHLCWADCLAELAGDAALLARWVAAQHVLATEAGADGALLKGVVDLLRGRGVERVEQRGRGVEGRAEEDFMVKGCVLAQAGLRAGTNRDLWSGGCVLAQAGTCGQGAACWHKQGLVYDSFIPLPVVTCMALGPAWGLVA